MTGMEPGSLLYVCDLDGTLLRSDATLSDFAREGINRLLEAGVRITLASSRGTPAMRALLTDVELRLPVMEFNGAFISELDSGRHLASNPLSSIAAQAATETIIATGAEPVVSGWDGKQDRVWFGRRMNEGTSWYVAEKQAYGDPRLTSCSDLLATAIYGEVASVVGFVRDPEATSLVDQLRKAVDGEAAIHSARNYYCPGWTEIQVQHRMAEKGAAMPALLAACNAAEAEVVACGDHLNDLGLFAAATYSIAPANAHPAVLESATEVVSSNDEDGVVRHLLELHIGE